MTMAAAKFRSPRLFRLNGLTCFQEDVAAMALGTRIVRRPNAAKRITFNALTNGQNAKAATSPFYMIEFPTKRSFKVRASSPASRATASLRVEGKEYIVQDAGVKHFRV